MVPSENVQLRPVRGEGVAFSVGSPLETCRGSKRTQHREGQLKDFAGMNVMSMKNRVLIKGNRGRE